MEFSGEKKKIVVRFTQEQNMSEIFTAEYWGRR